MLPRPPLVLRPSAARHLLKYLDAPKFVSADAELQVSGTLHLERMGHLCMLTVTT
jgi:hypothetical protein